jgi:hypothetical protein
MKQILKNRNTQTVLKQGTENAPELQLPDVEMQPLRQYLGLLRMNVIRYEYLKESGAPDAILYIEKGLIDRQILFLFKVCNELMK